MIKLTEEMVIARTRISDLQSVKKLNCWGSDINDVTLLRKMPNVQVLALSVNQIKTLEDFQFCEKLEELYIRKNDIKNLSDVCYLKGLSKLRNLWLADNPCSTFKTTSEADSYRMTVIRALPQLEKLDDVLVTISEKQDAMKFGLDVSVTITEEKENCNSSQSESIKLSNDIISVAVDSNSDSRLPNFDWNTQNNASKSNNTVSPSLEIIETNTKLEVELNQSPNKEVPTRRFSTMSCSNSNQIHQTDEIHSSESAPVSRRSSLASSTFSPTVETNFTPAVSVSPSTANNEQILSTRCPIHNSNSSEAIGTREASVAETSLNSNSSSNLNRKASTVTSHPDFYEAIPINDSRNCYAEPRPTRVVQDLLPPRVSSLGFANQTPHQTPIFASGQNERFSPTRSRNRNRASNLLMATLCLVNELDFASLEVLAMAIRNRMDDLQVDE